MIVRLAALVGMIVAASPAAAYVGPGAGIGVLGTMIALLGMVALAIVGFVWYPLKRVLKRRKAAEPGQADKSD